MLLSSHRPEWGLAHSEFRTNSWSVNQKWNNLHLDTGAARSFHVKTERLLCDRSHKGPLTVDLVWCLRDVLEEDKA